MEWEEKDARLMLLSAQSLWSLDNESMFGSGPHTEPAYSHSSVEVVKGRADKTALELRSFTIWNPYATETCGQLIR